VERRAGVEKAPEKPGSGLEEDAAEGEPGTPGVPAKTGSGSAGKSAEGESDHLMFYSLLNCLVYFV